MEIRPGDLLALDKRNFTDGEAPFVADSWSIVDLSSHFAPVLMLSDWLCFVGEGTSMMLALFFLAF